MRTMTGGGSQQEVSPTMELPTLLRQSKEKLKKHFIFFKFIYLGEVDYSQVLANIY